MSNIVVPVILTGDGTGFSKELKKQAAQLEQFKRLAQEVGREINKALKDAGTGTGSSGGWNKARGGLQGLSKDAQIAQGHISLMSQAWKEGSNYIDKRYLRSVTGVREALYRLNKEFKTSYTAHGDYTRSMNSIEMAHARFMMRGNLITRTLNNMSTQLINVGKNAQWTGRQMMVGITAPIAAVGAMAVKSAMDIGVLDREIRRLLEDTGGMFDALDKQSIALAGKWGVARTEIKKTQAIFAQAGFNKDIDELTELAVSFAALGDFDMPAAAEMVRNFRHLGIQGKELETVIAKLDWISDETSISLEELASAMPKVAGYATIMGSSIEETAAMLAGFTSRGIEADQAARALRGGMSKLNSALAMMEKGDGSDSGRRLKALKESLTAIRNAGVNISFRKQNGEVRTATEMLYQLAQGWNELRRQGKHEDAAIVLRDMFGQDQVARGSALLEEMALSMDQFTASGRDFAKAMAIADSSVDLTLQRWSSQLAQFLGDPTTQLQGQIQELITKAQELGKRLIPVATTIMNAINGIVDTFNNLPESTKKTIMSLIGALALLGPVVYISGQAMIALGTVAKGLIAPFKQFFHLIEQPYEVWDWTEKGQNELGRLEDAFNSGKISAAQYQDSLDHLLKSFKEQATIQTIIKDGQNAEAVARQQAIATINEQTAAQLRLNAAQMAQPGGRGIFGAINRENSKMRAARSMDSVMELLPAAVPEEITLEMAEKSLKDRLARRIMKMPDFSGDKTQARNILGPKNLYQASDYKKIQSLQHTIRLAEARVETLSAKEGVHHLARELAQSEVGDLDVSNLTGQITWINDTKKKLETFKRVWGYDAPISINPNISDPLESLRDFSMRFDEFNNSLIDSVEQIANRSGGVINTELIKSIKSDPRMVEDLWRDALDQAGLKRMNLQPSLPARNSVNEAAKDIVRIRDAQYGPGMSPVPLTPGMLKEITQDLKRSSGSIDLFGPGGTEERLTEQLMRELRGYDTDKGHVPGYRDRILDPRAIASGTDPYSELSAEAKRVARSMKEHSLPEKSAGKLLDLQKNINQIYVQEIDNNNKISNVIKRALGSDKLSSSDKKLLRVSERQLASQQGMFREALERINRDMSMGVVPDSVDIAHVRRRQGTINTLKSNIQKLTKSRSTALVDSNFDWMDEDLFTKAGVLKVNQNVDRTLLARKWKKLMGDSYGMGQTPRGVDSALARDFKNTVNNSLFSDVLGPRRNYVERGMEELANKFGTYSVDRTDRRSTKKSLAGWIKAAYDTQNPWNVANLNGLPDEVREAIARTVYAGYGTDQALQPLKQILSKDQLQQASYVMNTIAADIMREVDDVDPRRVQEFLDRAAGARHRYDTGRHPLTANTYERSFSPDSQVFADVASSETTGGQVDNLVSGFTQSQIDDAEQNILDVREAHRRLTEQLSVTENEIVLAEKAHRKDLTKSKSKMVKRLRRELEKTKKTLDEATDELSRMTVSVFDVTDADGVTRRFANEAEYQDFRARLDSQAREDAARRVEQLLGSSPQAANKLKEQEAKRLMQIAERRAIAENERILRKRDEVVKRVQRNADERGKRSLKDALLGRKAPRELTDNEYALMGRMHLDDIERDGINSTQRYYSDREMRQYSRYQERSVAAQALGTRLSYGWRDMPSERRERFTNRMAQASALTGINRDRIIGATPPGRFGRTRQAIGVGVRTATAPVTAAKNVSQALGSTIAKSVAPKKSLLSAAAWITPIGPMRAFGRGLLGTKSLFTKLFAGKAANTLMTGMFGPGMAQGATAAIGAVAPFIPILIAIAAIVLILWKNFNKWIDTARPGIEKLIEAGKMLFKAVVEPLKGVFERLKGEGESTGNMWDNIGKIIGGVAAVIAKTLEVIAPIIRYVMENVANAIYLIVQAFRAVIALVTGDWSDFGEALLKLWEGTWDAIKYIAGASVKGVVQLSADMWRAMIDGVAAGGNALRKIAAWINPLGGAGPLENVDKWAQEAKDGISSIEKALVGWTSDWATPKNTKAARDAGKRTGEKINEGINDGIRETPVEAPPMDPQEAEQLTNNFINAFQNQLGKVVDGWKNAALKAFDDWANGQVEAIDEKIEAIDKEIEAERQRDEDLDYLRRKEELRERERSEAFRYRADRDLAVYEGRFDDVKQMDYDYGQTVKGLQQDGIQIEEDRNRQLLDRERSAAKEKLNIEKETLQKQNDMKREALQAQLDAITEYIPKNVAEANRMQQEILAALGLHTDGYGQIGATQAQAWAANWSTAIANAKKQVAEEAFWTGEAALKAFASAIGVDLTPYDNLKLPEGSNETGASADYDFMSGGKDAGTPEWVLRLKRIFNPWDKDEYHTGGTVRGSGEVDAKLLSGEYVMNRAAVAKYGVSAMEAINKGNVPKYHSGGAVGAMTDFVANSFSSVANSIFAGFLSGGIGIGAGYDAGGKQTRSPFNLLDLLEAYTNQLIPQASIVEVAQGLFPEFLRRFHEWNAEMGGKFKIGSGWRSMEQQQRLYERWKKRVPGQAPAAPPGSSMHNFGLAIDLSPSRTTAAERAAGAKYGLRWPMSYEPWHVEPVEAKQWRAAMKSGTGISVPLVGDTKGGGLRIRDNLFKYHNGGYMIPSLDIGGMIARSGVAEVHRGERVLNRRETDIFNAGIGKTEINLHFDGGYFGSDRELEKLVDRIETDVLPKIQKIRGQKTRTYSKVVK